MDTTTQITSRVAEALREGFGLLAETHADRDLHGIYLPGGRYATIVRTGADHFVTVSKRVGKIEGSVQFAVALMREHGSKVLGRYELGRDGTLSVEHSLHASTCNVEVLKDTVLAVHTMACDAEAMLRAAGGLCVSVEDLDDDDDE